MTVDIMEWRLKELAATLAGLKQTGVPLIASAAGSYRAAGFSDDPGLYFFVPLIARALNLDPRGAYQVFVLALIGVSAAVGAAGLWLLARDSLAKLYSLGVVAVLAFAATRIADVYTVSFACPIALVPWIVLLAQNRGGRVPRWLLASAGVATAACNFVRSHAATSLVLFLVFLIALPHASSWKRRVGDLVVLAIAMTVASAALFGVIAYRDAYLARTAPGAEKTPVGHPFWHSAYLGLAFLKNPYVAAWDDRVAARRAAELAPDAPYLSERYEATLRSEYLRIVRSDPLFAVRTYTAKLLVALARALACVGLGLIALLRRRPPNRLLIPFAVAVAFEMLPALMTMPFHVYMLGLYTWSGIFGVFCVAHASDPQAFAAFERNTHRLASA